jgi:hypothetical protein
LVQSDGEEPGLTEQGAADWWSKMLPLVQKQTLHCLSLPLSSAALTSSSLQVGVAGQFCTLSMAKIMAEGGDGFIQTPLGGAKRLSKKLS